MLSCPQDETELVRRATTNGSMHQLKERRGEGWWWMSESLTCPTSKRLVAFEQDMKEEKKKKIHISLFAMFFGRGFSPRVLRNKVDDDSINLIG